MLYQIIAFNEKLGKISIKPHGFPSIDVDLPIDDLGHAYEGEKLDHFLKGFLPTQHVEREIKLDRGIKNAKKIHALVKPQARSEDITHPTKPASESLRMSVLAILYEEGLIK